MQERRIAANLRQTLDEMTELLQHHRALEALARRQDTPQRGIVEQLQRRQNQVELQRRVSPLHLADLAFVLGSMPHDDRLLIWAALDSRQAAEVLVELEPSARTSLIAQTERRRLKEIASHL